MIRSLALFAALLAPTPPAIAAPVVAAYYAAKGDPAAAGAIRVERVTHLLYAFATVCDGSALPAECAGRASYSLALPAGAAHRAERAALFALEARRPGLGFLVSVGGWGMPHFPAIVASRARRARFIASVVALMRANPGFDGVDIDWEYPGGGDNARALLTGAAHARERRDHAALMRELRRALDTAGGKRRRYLLTAAVAGYPRTVAAVDWRALSRVVDLLFVMSYDFTSERAFEANGDFSGGGGAPGHHANVRATVATGGYGADAMVDNLVRAGVPAAKLALGVGFYGREWAGVAPPPGNAGAVASSGRFVGTPTTIELRARAAAGGLSYAYDAAAGAAYLTGAAGGFISFEDRRAICAKGRLVVERGLAGLFAWEASQDDGPLIEALADAADGDCRTAPTMRRG